MKSKRQIINIINFIRGVEPRHEVDLIEPVIEQIQLLKEYNFSGTFLIQYDALINPLFTDLLQKECGENIEIGVWLEIVQPLAEKAGIKWRGRFAWDWHANVGFSVGYTLYEREKLIDELFCKFRQVFGYYPKSMGSWIIDVHSLKYATDKYGIDASCNCKDQWGTDGYTLWGGYYNQAYYPSVNNVFSPAQNGNQQIRTPIFRMLGSDPIYQYDNGLNVGKGAARVQGVTTLEPVYKHAGGGDRQFVDWYLKENFNNKCLAFSYTQAGQENSFGWEAMRDGLVYQFEKFAKMRGNSEVEIETLGESGRWFKKTFPLTPATSMFFDGDMQVRNTKSLWYNCKNYRVNLICDENGIRIRDICIFNENYRERYFENVCESSVLKFDTLPFVDGNRHSGGGILSGMHILCESSPLYAKFLFYNEENSSVTAEIISSKGKIIFRFEENEIKIYSEILGLRVIHRFCHTATEIPEYIVTEQGIKMRHNNFDYKVETNAKKLNINEIEYLPKDNNFTIRI